MSLSKSKKTIAVACLALSSQMIAPQAKAFIGAAVVNPVTIVSGILLSLSGPGLYRTSEHMVRHEGTSTTSDLLNIAGFFNTFMGIFLLDQKAGTIQFQEMSQDAAKNFGVTEQEAQSYNQELGKVNLVNQTVNETLSRQEQVTPEQVADLWKSYQGELSEDTVSAIRKVVSAQ